MQRWRLAIIAASLSQIAMGLVGYTVSRDQEGWRLLGLFGLAGGTALLGIVARPVRTGAVGLNGLMALGCLPSLAIGLFGGLTPPSGSPLGEWWFYPGIAGVAVTCAINAAGVSRIAEHDRRRAQPLS